MGRWILAVVVVVALVLTLPLLFGYRRYVIVSGSMSPTIRTGSLVYGKVVDRAELKKGTIVTFQAPKEYGGHTVTHRIFEVKSDGFKEGTVYRTKGDANETPDPWTVSLASRQIVPAYWIPGIGYVMLTLASPAGRIGVITIPALIIAFVTIGSMVVDLRKRRAQPPVDTTEIGNA